MGSAFTGRPCSPGCKFWSAAQPAGERSKAHRAQAILLGERLEQEQDGRARQSGKASNAVPAPGRNQAPVEEFGDVVIQHLDAGLRPGSARERDCLGQPGIDDDGIDVQAGERRNRGTRARGRPGVAGR